MYINKCIYIHIYILPKDTYDLKLNKVTLCTWSFRIPTAIFFSKNWYNLGSLPSPPEGGFLFKIKLKENSILT